jgi:hypothetical protein
MSRLPLLLLLSLLPLGSANAIKVDSSDVSFAHSSFMLDRNPTGNEFITMVELSQITPFTSEKNAVSSSSWVVGLGLCLVFIGYKLKNNAE